MNIHNLQSYQEYKKYYNLYLDNNSQLNEIIKNIIQKYNFEYNPEYYYRLNEKNLGTRNISELSGIIIMFNSIIEKNFYGYCIKTNKKYVCEKMYFLNEHIFKNKFMCYTYHFNCSNDEFIIFFSWEYFSPMLIYYPKTNSVYNISYRYSNISSCIDYINKINYSKIYYPKQNYITYVLGIMHNAGHYFWQEIYGLMLLFEYNLINNIDEFLIYNYDYLNIGNILKTKYNKSITYLISNVQKHYITVNLTKHYINNSLITSFKDIYELKENNNYNEINILFDIRTNDRIWLNQIPIIINIMNAVKQRFNNYIVNFFISGFYNYDKIQSNVHYNSNKEILKQNKIFNIIQKSVSFPICNLINFKLSEIVKISQRIDLCIANTGSGISFFYQAIFNKDTICLTLNKKHKEFNLQRYSFENNISNCTFIKPQYIIDFKGNFFLKLGYLLPLVIDKLNKKKLNT